MLVVLGLDFEVGLGVGTGGASLWGGVAGVEMATVAAAPGGGGESSPGFAFFDIIEELLEAGFVGRLDGGDLFEVVG